MPTPIVAKYSINQAANVQVSETQNKVILVNWMKSASGYQTTDMLYQSEPFRLQAFAKNAWNATPASMLQTLLVESLRNSHAFRVVLSAPSGASVDYRLDTTLLKLQQEIHGENAQVRLTMDASLIQVSPNKAIKSQRFEVVIPTSANPQEGVVAVNRASQQILGQMTQFTIEATRG